MSWPFGPFTAATGSVIQSSSGGIRIPQQAVQVEFENDSRFWLYVSFSPIKPKTLVITQLGSDLLSAGFQYAVRPFGYKVIPIPQEIDDYPFQGTLWVLPVDRTNVLANSGSSSMTSDVIITALAKGETPTFATMLARQTDLTSQPRVITLLPSMDSIINFQGNVAPPAVNGVVELLNLGNPNDAGRDDIWFVYLYDLGIWPNGSNTNAGGIDFQIMVDLRTSGGVSVGFPWPQPIARGQCYWGAANGIPVPYIMPGIHPRDIGFNSQTANLDHVSILLKTISALNPATGLTFDGHAYMLNGSSGSLLGTGAGATPGPIGQTIQVAGGVIF